MCRDILVLSKDGYTRCFTVGELASLLGVEPAKVSDDPPDFCLCNAHLDALGARETTDEEGWPIPSHVIDIRSAP